MAIILLSSICKGRQKVTVSGYLKDSVSGESLVGGVISIEGTDIKTASNNYGFFSLTLPPGEYHICFSYLGYETVRKEMNLSRDVQLLIHLTPRINQIREVVIHGGGNSNVGKPVSAFPLSINSVRLLPPLLGESDLIRSFQLLPGVSSVGDGAAGFNVRGGGIDQNLVLMDEAPLYFTSHLFNLFSVANPDAMKDASLYKTEMPARFGGRLSSVLDTRMKDGNNKEWSAEGGLGLIASRITIEGPVVKDKSSMIVSARRSYTDLITRHFSDPEIRDNSIYFYDLSAKLNLSLSERDRLFISGYFGKDHIVASDIFALNWGNGTGTLRLSHVFSPRLFFNSSFIYSDYRYRLASTNNPTTSYRWNAGIVDYAWKNAFSWYLNSRNTIYAGAEAALHNFTPGKAEPAGPESLFNAIEVAGQRAAEYNVYWDHEISLSDIIAAEYGVRFSVFQSLAKGSTTVYDYEGEPGQRKEAVDAHTFHSGQGIKTYNSLQPRISLKVKTAADASFKGSYSRTVQNLHLISNTISTSPLDVWAPSSYNIKPELADQFSLGYFRDFSDSRYETSVELYFRKLYNQIDFIDGAQTILNQDQEADMLFGEGRAYGTEWYFRKTSGRLNGWISYTLSRTERKFEGINNGAYFPARYDKTHSLAAVVVYQLKPGVSLSGTYTFASGTPATLPSDRYVFAGYPVQYNAGNYRNNYRIASYHRLDLSATLAKQKNKLKRGHSEWVFSVFNALNRRNTFSVYLRQDKENPENLEAVRFAMFGTIIPAITWNFKL